MVFSYLNHAGVYRQGRANHVDIGCGSGALPLGEAAACRWVGRGVVEGMRGGISMGRAVEVQKESNIIATAAIACLKRVAPPLQNDTCHSHSTTRQILISDHLKKKKKEKNLRCGWGCGFIFFSFLYLSILFLCCAINKLLSQHKQNQQVAAI